MHYRLDPHFGGGTRLRLVLPATLFLVPFFLMPPARCRYWCATLNNPDLTSDEFSEKVQACSHFKYCVFQLERGESGTPHFQVYVEFTKPKRMQFLKRQICNGLHLEPRRGTAEQARDYCRKPDSRIGGPWELGQWDPSTAGQRNDILDGVRLVREGGLEALIREKAELYVRFSRGFDALHQRLQRRSRDDPPDVMLLIGNPGCGKTHYFYEREGFEQSYKHQPGSDWFDGYDGHPALLLDDFSGASSGFRLDQTLQFFDRYPLRLPVKGSFTHLVAKRIYITTNIHPYQWFKWRGRQLQYAALVRRFTHVFVFESDFIPVLLVPSMMQQFFYGRPHGGPIHGNTSVPFDPYHVPNPGDAFGDWRVPVFEDIEQ